MFSLCQCIQQTDAGIDGCVEIDYRKVEVDRDMDVDIKNV